MMIIVFWGLFFLFLGAGYMVLVSKIPGYVLISLGDFAIEFNLWALLTGLVFAVLAFRVVKGLLRYMLRSLGSGYFWVRNSRSYRLAKKSQSGFLKYIEGDSVNAKKALLANIKNEENPLLHYVLAAKCAQQLGDTQEAQQLLEQAKSDNKVPNDNAAIVITQVNILLAEKKYEDCLALLEAAPVAVKNGPAYFPALISTYVGLEQWQELANILPKIKQKKQFTDEKFQNLERQTYSALLTGELQASDGRRESLDSIWQKIPKALRKTNPLLTIYCQALHEHKHDDLATSLIQKQLPTEWDNELVDLFGQLTLADAEARLKAAEKWLSHHQDNSVLLCALARMSQQNFLWGKAKGYYEASIDINPQPTVYAELAELLVTLGEEQKGQALYQQALTLKSA